MQNEIWRWQSDDNRTFTVRLPNGKIVATLKAMGPLMSNGYPADFEDVKQRAALIASLKEDSKP